MPWKDKLNRLSTTILLPTPPTLTTLPTSLPPSRPSPLSDSSNVVSSPTQQESSIDEFGGNNTLRGGHEVAQTEAQSRSSTTILPAQNPSSNMSSGEQKKRRRASLLGGLQIPRLLSRSSSSSNDDSSSSGGPTTHTSSPPPISRIMTNPPPTASLSYSSGSPPATPSSPSSPRSPRERVDPHIRKPVPSLEELSTASAMKTRSRSQPSSPRTSPNSATFPSSSAKLPTVPLPSPTTHASTSSPRHVRTSSYDNKVQNVSDTRPRSMARSSSSSSRTTDTITQNPAVWIASPQGGASPSHFDTTSTGAGVPPNSSSIHEPLEPLQENHHSTSTTVRKAIPVMWRQLDGGASTTAIMGGMHAKAKSVEMSRAVSAGTPLSTETTPLLKRTKTVQGTVRRASMMVTQESSTSESQRLRNVWRARKMAQVFGTEPPKELLQAAEGRSTALPSWDDPSTSPYTSPSTSSVTTPSTSLDFGRGIRTVTSVDDGLRLHIPFDNDPMLSSSSAISPSDEWSDNEDFERSDFRVRRLRAQKLARFFGAPAPVDNGLKAVQSPPPLNVVDDSGVGHADLVPVERPDTPFVTMRTSTDSDPDTALSEPNGMAIIAVGHREVDNYNLGEMQEVMAKLRKLR